MMVSGYLIQKEMIDVAIIGSGPAGCSTAIMCAKMGLSVTLLEKEQNSINRPGENLHPGIESILKTLDVFDDIIDANFLRHQGNYITWDSSTRFESFGNIEDTDWNGFQVTRPEFDNILINKAIELGVKVNRSCKILNVISENNRVIGLKTSKSDLLTTFVIDASGSYHWLAKKLAINIEKFSPTLIAHYGYVTGNCNVLNNNPMMTAIEDGWLWLAKINSNLAQWVKINFSNHTIDKNYLPQEYFGLKKLGQTCGRDVTWRIVSKPSGYGYFIVGDASSILDPASSHGIAKAMMSGMMAAHMIAKINDNSSVELQAIGEYSRWIKDWFLHDVKKLMELYKLHPSSPQWTLT